MEVGPGDALGARYRLVERIGSGAAGEVWRVRDVRDDSEAAAKLLRREHVRDTEVVERFVRERSVLTRLRHPRVVGVRDLVVEGETLAIVMELVGGGTLRDLLVTGGPLAAGRALRATAGVLDALAAAHAIGTVHRDVKPDNVLLAEGVDDLGDAVRVTDFGIAQVVADGPGSTRGLIGTPEYLSPEMLATGTTGSPGDVYSAGVLLYELLCGRTPFSGTGNDFTVAYRHVSVRPPALDVPERLWRVLERMLAKDPERRPTAVEAAGLLRALLPAVACLPPLPRGGAVVRFEDVDRPATALRGVGRAPEDGGLRAEDRADPRGLPAPDLGPASQATVVRPVPLRRAPAAEATTVGPPRRRVDPRVVLGSLAAVLLLVGAVVVATQPRGTAASPGAASAILSAEQHDLPLPSGLGVERTATYDPGRREVVLRTSYSAQSSPLGGEFLEVIPAGEPAEGAGCPAVTWTGATGTRNQPSISGIGVECGWSLAGLDLEAQGSVEVSATVAVALPDQDALDAWLAAAAAATTAAVADPTVTGTAFPVQRIRDVRIDTAARTVSQTVLPVTLLPVWPGGVDPIDPLLITPSVGPASSMLDAIAGGTGGVRLADGCGGAVAVSSDGLTVTALSVTPACRVRAHVGDFSDLVSAPFAITTRE